MTTIAYKDSVVAYDGRAAAGDTIMDDDFNKMFVNHGVRFWFCGKLADIEGLINAYHNWDGSEYYDSCAIVYDKGRLYNYHVTEDNGFHKSPIMPGRTYAIGSGADHALTAMDMGASAFEAVKMAAKRDVFTGGKIRKYKLR